MSGKKQKDIILGLAIALVVLVSLLPFTTTGRGLLKINQEEKLLLDLLQGSGAELKSAQVSGWVRVDEWVLGSDEPEEMAGLVADSLGLNVAAAVSESWQNPYARGASLSGALADGSPVSILGQVLEEPDGNQVAHVMVNIAITDYRRSADLKRSLAKTLRQYGKEERVALSLTGRIEEELSESELLNRAEELMQTAEAQVLEQVVQDNLVSLTGYSARLADNLRYAGTEVNINVALRRDPAVPGASVYVASPVILTEY